MDHIKMMDVCMKSSLDDRNITASGSLTSQVVQNQKATLPPDLQYTSDLYPLSFDILLTST